MSSGWIVWLIRRVTSRSIPSASPPTPAAKSRPHQWSNRADSAKRALLLVDSEVQFMLNKGWRPMRLRATQHAEGRSADPVGTTPRVPRSHAMSTAFRVTVRDGGSIGDADTLDGVIELVQSAARPISDREDLPRSRHGRPPGLGMGEVIKDLKGGIQLDLPPWTD